MALAEMSSSLVAQNGGGNSRPATTGGLNSRRLSWTGEDEHVSEHSATTPSNVESVFLTEDNKLGLQLSARGMRKAPQKSEYLQDDQGVKITRFVYGIRP